MGSAASDPWLGPDSSELADVVVKMTGDNLRAYVAQPMLIDEHAGSESNLAHGGYGRRQIQELVQNGADQLLDDRDPAALGRIQVVLTKSALYCANEGDPISQEGVEALLMAHVSPKRGAEIGRFGLGFKSVLGISTKPQFFCRNVSFGFDAEWAREQIEAAVPGRDTYPVLRAARLLDPTSEAELDPILAELMDWATTVVRVPLDLPEDWLVSNLEHFPSEFLLFSPHVGRLVLEDRTDGLVREVRLTNDGPVTTLHEDGASQRWRTFRSTIKPSEEARRTSGSHIFRDELPVIWAVPLEGNAGVGRFWAFFPLRDETTLTGIINAPWQINDDRTGLLEGSKLNGELIDAVLDIAGGAMSVLVEPQDPGRILELLPARGREARCWGDEVLTARFHEREGAMALVPDQDGNLQVASELNIPELELPHDAIEIWSSAHCAPTGWVHPSAFTNNTRKHRLLRLIERSGSRPVSADAWLEALVDADPGPASSSAAIRAAAAIADDLTDWAIFEQTVRKALIIECENGQFARVDPEWVWLPEVDTTRPSKLTTVHPEIVADIEANFALQMLGIKTVTPVDELRVWMEEASSEDDWASVWEIARGIDSPDEAAQVLRQGASAGRFFMVRTVEGTFRPFNEVLLPGSVIPATSSSDDSVKVDMAFHAQELGVLQAAGVVAGPVAAYQAALDPLVDVYRNLLIDRYLAELAKAGSTPRREQICVSVPEGPGPMSVLARLSREAKAQFVSELFDIDPNFTYWTVAHRSQGKYPERHYECLALSTVRSDGLLATSLGPTAVSGAVGQSLRAYSDLLPVCSLTLQICNELGLPREIGDLQPGHWNFAFSALRSSTDDIKIGKVYALAAQAGMPTPELIRCRRRALHEMLPPADIGCASDRERFEGLTGGGDPAILVTDSAAARALIEAWGLIDASELVEVVPEVIEAGPASALVDLFPQLKDLLRARGAEAVDLVPCEEIEVVATTPSGAESTPKGFHFDRDHSKIYYLAEDGLESALSNIDAELALGLADGEARTLASQGWKKELRQKTQRIREQSDDAARLIEAVGARAIHRHLPSELINSLEDFGETIDDYRAAELLLQVKGYDALKELRSELEEAHLDPPTQWAGSSAARNYVRDLGFPVEFAGSPSRRRDSVLSISGPMVLPELHDYQRAMADEIKKLLRSEIGESRGLLSLPTGAGKTRVAVQALTEAVEEGALGSPIIWLAQSDELCEQAVQAWAQVWRFKGTKDVELTISRLWGENEAQEETDGSQVVVATPDKLLNRIGDDSYDWLTRSSCVVIDEAHTAIATTYTQILEWLGISQRGAVRTRCPLIGLSATPFKGVSESETARLAARFGRFRFDRIMQEDTYEKLQEKGILSRVEGETLEGVSIEVDDKTSRHFERFQEVPKDFFKALATDSERNRRILDSLESKPADWPVLLFAASRAHAHTIAALLTIRGIRSVAIDSETDMGLRRRYIEEFRNGEIRVMCNYMVFSQGFDAPEVRAVYITRPTFSPNAYQQMIGRGLRGPLNGGKDTCLIVNVVDNWNRFGDQLAYREFEYLWDGSDG